MPSIEYSGLKITGGKVFAIFTLLGALGGAAWTGFTFYQDYLDMKEKVLTYTEPDLSGFDKKIALVETQTEAQIELVSQQLDALKSELEIILGEIDLISQVSRELKDDLKTDLRNVEQDVRHITEIVNDVEDRQKEDSRELIEEMKLMEESLDLKINKALNNPLSGMSAKTK
jgi:signal transduction histidine kinase